MTPLAIPSRPPRVVIDPEVLVLALASRRGASFQLLQLVRHEHVQLALEPLIVIEYGIALETARQLHGLHSDDVGTVLDFLCAIAVQPAPHFLWRPVLRDPQCDLLLRLAVATRASHIVAQYPQPLVAPARFGIRSLRPGHFLHEWRLRTRRR